jgi:hypothetical protein
MSRVAAASRAAAVLALAITGCPARPAPRPTTPAAPVAVPIDDAPLAMSPVVSVAPDTAPLEWLKGSTHVHALPSGDSTTPIPEVIAWYERHGYDFIALTDHNRVSELPDGGSTAGKVAVRAPRDGLIVLAGIELTFNPDHCLDPPDLDGKCRIHLNGLGVTRRPAGKLEWAERRSPYRLDMYARGLGTTRQLGGIAQLNHPQWHWGMTGELLAELGRRGARLVEIANRQFDNWNVGDPLNPSMEALWDAALAAGVDLWGVATDDAHHYHDDGSGRYPAGGGWIVVRAVRDPDAILAALAAGRFYASTGVVLARAEVEGDELIVEVDPASPGDHAIAFVSAGTVVQAISARSARATIPEGSYLRAVVRRTSDGAQAWVQPARR